MREGSEIDFISCPSTSTRLEWLSRQQQHLWKDLKSYTPHTLLKQGTADETSGLQNLKARNGGDKERRLLGE